MHPSAMQPFKRLLVPLLLAAAFPFAARAQVACPIERAHYVLRGTPNVTAGFQNLPKLQGWLTTIAFHIDFRNEGDRFWWLFDQGSSRFLTMISTTDVNAPGWQPPDEEHKGAKPLGTTHVWYADQNYVLSYSMPDQGTAAPQHILIPDLEEIAWYGLKPRRGIPTAFFDLATCGQ
ncbi:hypothetical protein [Phenylobacterium sp.]|jgi:hypothetical protein|uniref:hypothetical protein n=1 Tax=Phenylobacterium sp. TaxID=1871053 RepID=UPI002E30E34E|nr:hypothetical protein [Phenylobacterium sp.]HEX4711479.1 hypothetical protein [Phenylobacterium sp.]